MNHARPSIQNKKNVFEVTSQNPFSKTNLTEGRKKMKRNFDSLGVTEPPRKKQVVLQMEDCQCPICFEVFCQPHSLPCSHTYCLACICEWMKKSMEHDTPRCPECRHEIDQIPVPVKLLERWSQEFEDRKMDTSSCLVFFNKYRTYLQSCHKKTDPPVSDFNFSPNPNPPPSIRFELARSGTAHCRACRQTIAIQTPRYAFPTTYEQRTILGYAHPQCQVSFPMHPSQIPGWPLLSSDQQSLCIRRYNGE